MAKLEFPLNGMPRQEILSALKAIKSEDSDWKHGRMFSLIFNAGEDVANVAEDAYSAFVVENALSPFAFPSLLKMETEVTSMMADLLGGDENTAGNMTSGGSESIMLAVKAARDHARDRKPHVTQPELLMPLSAHPAFNKAAHYLGLKTVIVPTDKETLMADVEAMQKAITGNTIMVVGSAPSYPHGMIDPIANLAKIAEQSGIWMHVDACIGGLELPFIQKLGYPIPIFDFRIPGVCSMSADIHKYGFTPKGASVVLYRKSELRKYQLFTYTDWPGGIYATSNMSGSRPGGPIASAWAVMKYLGTEGYMKLAQKSMEATEMITKGIETIPELHVLGKPPATVFAIGSDALSVFALSEKMKKRRWYIESQHLPPCLHMTVSPRHAFVVEPFLSDLGAAVKETAKLKPEDITGEAALYGMISSLPDRGMAKDFALQYFNDLYRVH